MRRTATKWVNVESIDSYFESLSDPRHMRNRKHLLVDIAVIAVRGMVCGSDGPTAIHRWDGNRDVDGTGRKPGRDGNRDRDSDGYPSFWYQSVLCQEQRE
jgi:hypothetical protein